MFFRKKEELLEEDKTKTSAEKIQYYQFTEDNDDYALEIVNSIKGGNPAVINFEKIDEFSTNKYIAFFTGVVVALDSRPILINNDTYLFALKEDLLDGSIRKFIDEIPD